MATKTLEQYNRQLAKCREIFVHKTRDYGMSWRVMRIPSLIDQIFIKAQRIRSIEEAGEQRISDPIRDEYYAIINYCIIALIQIEKGASFSEDLSEDELFEIYDQKASEARQLMLAKNHDYGEAWRQMWITSLTDLILSKLLRIRQIIGNEGRTIISEGIDANLHDMINYAVFALIRMDEAE